MRVVYLLYFLVLKSNIIFWRVKFGVSFVDFMDRDLLGKVLVYWMLCYIDCIFCFGVFFGCICFIFLELEFEFFVC